MKMIRRRPPESEVRHLLSRAWSRRRRQADSSGVHNAIEMDLNREFEDRDDGRVKYIFLMTILLALLVYAVTQMIGLE